MWLFWNMLDWIFAFLAYAILGLSLLASESTLTECFVLVPKHTVISRKLFRHIEASQAQSYDGENDSFDVTALKSQPFMTASSKSDARRSNDVTQMKENKLHSDIVALKPAFDVTAFQETSQNNDAVSRRAGDSENAINKVSTGEKTRHAVSRRSETGHDDSSRNQRILVSNCAKLCRACRDHGAPSSYVLLCNSECRRHHGSHFAACVRLLTEKHEEMHGRRVSDWTLLV